MYSSRDSRSSNITPRDIEIQFFTHQSESDYPVWWTRERLAQWFRSLPEESLWICYICISALMSIIWVAVGFSGLYFDVLDTVYNISYAIHVVAIAYNTFLNVESADITFWIIVGFLLDIMTFSHYVSKQTDYKLVCYYLRLYRPFKYLWALNDYNLKGSIPGTTLKYCYIFLIIRVTWALIWLNLDKLEQEFKTSRRALLELETLKALPSEQKIVWLRTKTANQFLSALYIVNKMFIPIGPSVAPDNDIERIACMLVMITGCMVVTGAAVASLSLVISIYMRPEASFRARYRLIIKEMKESHVSPSLREKVETFYKMYWHKQRAVSATQLMPTFPPTLPAAIYADIYFEATQKCRILRDLSYQFLSEVSKKMQTVHYIPGDAIIKRLSRKSSVIFITCGDLEMLTAEDDSTAILRMTRGTILAPCAGVVAAGCGLAHLEIRAATFCTAHVLPVSDLWRVALKHGRNNEQAEILLSAFYDHLERVKRHYMMKVPQVVKYKSSILHFKRNLMALKEARDSNGDLLLARTDVFLEVAGCYIMRNRADASLTDESDAICLRPTFPCILQPSSSLQKAWNLFVATIIIIVCLTHPFYLVFMKEVPIKFRFYDYAVTGIYVVDLIAYLSTGANVEEGVPITFAQTSSQQMRSHWFVLDVLGTLPIFEFIGTGHCAGINKILRLPKVFRVLKGLEDHCVYRGHVLRFLSYTLLLLIACYLIAALQQGFMCFQFDYCLVTNFTHSPFWEAMPLDEETVQHRLFFGLYWAISMITFTTHMETWGPENWNNVLYTMFVLEICIVLRIFMEAVYSATIMVTTALREDYDSCIADVKNFLIRNQVDPLLRHRFITYLELSWYTDKAFTMTSKKKSIFYDLPPHVYQDIVARQHSKYIMSVPFMKLISKEDLKNVSSKAKLFYTSPNEIILNTGDVSNEMYVIKQGICEVLSPETGEVVSILGIRASFGILECILRLPAFYTIRAVTHVQVFSISKKHLFTAIAVPQIQDAINFAKNQEEYKRLLKHHESFLMYSPPKPTPNTERFPLPRKHEQDFAFLHPFYTLGVLSVLRYVFPRFTIRPDGKYLTRYEWFRGVCSLMTAMVFPGYGYLVLQWPKLYYIAFLLDLSAYFDILQRMLVGYFNERGILIYHPSSTAAHYFKGAFITDLCGCLPMENLEGTWKAMSGNKHRVTEITQLLMMNRLIQLYRLPSAMGVLSSYFDRRDIILVIKAIPLFVVVLNVFTSLVVLSSVDILYSGNDWDIIPHADVGGSWINLFKNAFRFNLTESPFNMHLACYFWVVYETTTTGYNVVKPSNFNVMMILFTVMSIGAMIITYFSVRIISIRANVNKALAEFQEHMKDIIAFMKKEALDQELQREVFDYYEYNWDKMGGIDYRHVLKLCQQITLRTDAILHIYGPTFAKCPILSQCDVSVLRVVGRAVNSEYFLRDMNIVECDDVIKDMYFVDFGGVDVRQTVAQVSTVVKLPRGSIFGNLEGTPTIRCPVTLIATTKVHLLKINSKQFYEIIEEFPSVRELMKKHCPENSNYIMGTYDAHKLSVATLSSPIVIRSWRRLIKHIYVNDKFLQFYFIIVSLVCVYLDVYNAGFQDNRTALILTLYVLDVAFYMKILIQFSSPHIAKSDNIRKVLLPIRMKYVKGEFRYDILSCIPIELLSFFSERHRWMIFALLRLNRMLRIVTVYNSLKRRQERITINLTLSTMLSVFIWFTVFVHTTTSIWYFIGVLEDFAEPYSSWLHKDKGDPWCSNEYVCALYFILTTFTQNGVGDIMPKKHSEVIFVSILQLISTLLFMIYVGEFSNIIQYQSFRSFSFYCMYLELQEFMKNNRVSKNLVTLVNKYSLHLWRESRGVQEPHFLNTAPHCLKLRIMSAAYLHHLQRHHIFEDCEPAFLRQLVGCLRLYTYNEGMYVVKESEITDSMYLIHTGKVHEDAEEHLVLPRVYPAGSYFGIGLEHDKPYTHSYKTLIKSQVLTLRLDDWAYLLQHFPISRNKIYGKNTHDGGGGKGSSRFDGPVSPRLTRRSRASDPKPKTARPYPVRSSLAKGITPPPRTSTSLSPGPAPPSTPSSRPSSSLSPRSAPPSTFYQPPTSPISPTPPPRPSTSLSPRSALPSTLYQPPTSSISPTPPPRPSTSLSPRSALPSTFFQTPTSPISPTSYTPPPRPSISPSPRSDLPSTFYQPPTSPSPTTTPLFPPLSPLSIPPPPTSSSVAPAPTPDTPSLPTSHLPHPSQLPNQPKELKNNLPGDVEQKETGENLENAARSSKILPKGKSAVNDDVDALKLEQEQAADSTKRVDEVIKLQEDVIKKGIAIDSKESLKDENGDKLNANISKAPTKMSVLSDADDTRIDERNLEAKNLNTTDEIKQIFTDEINEAQSGNRVSDIVKMYDTKQKPLEIDKKQTKTDNLKKALLEIDKKHSTQVEDKAPINEGVEQPIINYEDSSADLPEDITSGRQDRATSTSKMQRRSIRVRYEDDSMIEQKEKLNLSAQSTTKQKDGKINMDKSSESDEDEQVKPSSMKDNKSPTPP